MWKIGFSLRTLAGNPDYTPKTMEIEREKRTASCPSSLYIILPRNGQRFPLLPPHIFIAAICAFGSLSPSPEPCRLDRVWALPFLFVPPPALLSAGVWGLEGGEGKRLASFTSRDCPKGKTGFELVRCPHLRDSTVAPHFRLPGQAFWHSGTEVGE